MLTEEMSKYGPHVGNIYFFKLYVKKRIYLFIASYYRFCNTKQKIIFFFAGFRTSGHVGLCFGNINDILGQESCL